MEQLIAHWDAVLIAATFFGLVLLEGGIGLYRQHRRKADHWWIDFVSLAQLALLIKPLMFLTAALLLAQFAPEWRGALEDWPFWLGFLIVFLPDDFSHYWYHRWAHERPWMWPWHRTHHTTPAYQTSIAFRENWAWFWFMPGIWWSGAMVYLGLAEQVALSTALIGFHNVLIHNGLDIDRRWYRSKIGARIMAVLERVVQTPSLHRAHHGLGNNGVPMGNYGQTLFVWDVLFGTAQFVGAQRPERYGVMKGGEEPWYWQLWLPYAYRRGAKESHSFPNKLGSETGSCCLMQK